MLETIREYAGERLAESGEGEDRRRRHAIRHARTAVELYPSLREYSAETLQILREEQGNMRAALEFALQRDDVAVTCDLLYGLWFYWLTAGSGVEAAGWARRYLASPRERLSPLQRYTGDDAAGEILRFAGDPDTAAKLKRELVATGRAYPDAVIHGYAIARSTAATLSDLAYIELEAGNLMGARACAEEALALRRDLGLPHGIAHALLALANLAYFERDFVRARELLAEAIAGWEAAGSHGDALGARIAMAECELLLGRLDETAALLREAIPMLPKFPDQTLDVHALRVAGMLSAARGDGERCAALFGAADRKLEESGLTLFSGFEDETQRAYLQRARNDLGQVSFDAAYERGAHALDETAFELALSID
jgi:tetratricopeptide (TPR) repeat protein